MLSSMKEILEDAAMQGKAAGSFSAYSMEAVNGIIRAAEEMETPVIIQTAESRFAYAPFELMAPMMVNAAKQAKVKVAVHLDHGLHVKTVRQALEYGFTSVMFDASQKPLEENIRLTKEVMEIAAAYGATVEAEIGCVGGNEGMGDIKDHYTKPEEAERFARETGVDALAVAIGNAHGNYKLPPKLQFSVLEEIRQNVECPLVLHGGSGISFEDFRKAIDYGIRKINIATAILEAQREAARECLDGEQSVLYFKMSGCMTQKITDCIKKHIYVFNNQGNLSTIEEVEKC